MPISSIVSRQSAVKPGQNTSHALHAARAEFLQRRRGVWLQPFGLAEARLERHPAFHRREPERRGEQRAGLLALLVIRIAEIERALGHAVKAQHQLVAGREIRPAV